VLNVNLKGPMLLTQLAAKIMNRDHGGRIINIAAVTGVNARKKRRQLLLLGGGFAHADQMLRP
jgi:NAD(P)-dependent dehydrogenase (short-subunit alcohol dehydrogenase family)